MRELLHVDVETHSPLVLVELLRRQLAPGGLLLRHPPVGNGEAGLDGCLLLFLAGRGVLLDLEGGVVAGAGVESDHVFLLGVGDAGLGGGLRLFVDVAVVLLGLLVGLGRFGEGLLLGLLGVVGGECFLLPAEFLLGLGDLGRGDGLDDDLLGLLAGGAIGVLLELVADLVLAGDSRVPFLLLALLLDLQFLQCRV